MHNNEILPRRMGVDVSAETEMLSEELTDKQKKYKQIVEILTEANEPMTDREIARAMKQKGYIGYEERNAAAPRVTELIKEGRLEAIGKKKDSITDRMVRVVTIRDTESNT